MAPLETGIDIDEDFHCDLYMSHLPDAGYTPSLPPVGAYSVTASRPRNGRTGAALGGVTTR